MNHYFPELCERFGGNMKIELNLSIMMVIIFWDFLYFTKFFCHHKWNEASLLAIKMVYTSYLMSCRATQDLGNGNWTFSAARYFTQKLALRENYPHTKLSPARTPVHPDRIQTPTPQIPAFSPKTGKYGPGITPHQLRLPQYPIHGCSRATIAWKQINLI